MIVTGFTKQLGSDAEQKCAGRFLAWLGEARKGQWKSWPELLRRFPTARRMDDHEAHFPLAADGTGIRAAVIFNPGVLRLLCIAPATAARRQIPLSHPHSQPQPHES